MAPLLPVQERTQPRKAIGTDPTTHRAELSGKAAATDITEAARKGPWEYYRTHRAGSHTMEKGSQPCSSGVPPLALPQGHGRRHTERSNPWRASTEGDRTTAPHPGPPVGSGPCLRESTGDQNDIRKEGSHITHTRLAWKCTDGFNGNSLLPQCI